MMPATPSPVTPYVLTSLNPTKPPYQPFCYST